MMLQTVGGSRLARLMRLDRRSQRAAEPLQFDPADLEAPQPDALRRRSTPYGSVPNTGRQ